MRNLPAGVFGLLHGSARQEGGLIIPARPDVVRNLRDGWSNKNGVMWIHGPKTNHQMCQTVADALFLLEHERDVKWKPNTLVIVGREIGHVFLLLLDKTKKTVIPPPKKKFMGGVAGIMGYDLRPVIPAQLAIDRYSLPSFSMQRIISCSRSGDGFLKPLI